MSENMTGRSQRWPRAVIFDLDGTLVDSAPDLAAAVNTMLRDERLDPFDIGEVKSFVGHGLRRLVERAYAAREQLLSEDALTRKLVTFEAIYKACIAVRTRPYPGALDFVTALRARDIRTGICTNKAEPLTRALIDGLGIGALFDVVVGGQAAIVAKPAADMLLETLRRLDSPPATAIMVGDSHSDVACARAANVRVVGVTFGYTDIPMRDLEPDVLIDHFSEGFAAIADLTARFVPSR